MIKFSALTWSMIVSFCLAIVAIMLNVLVPAMVYVALSLLIVGFMLLTIKLYFIVSKKSKDDERIKEELLMELSMTDEGEEYIMKNSASSKKYRRMLRKEHINRFMPVIFSGLVTIIMIVLLLKVIIKF